MSPRERPWVAYVGPFSYPAGSAAARRVLGVSQSLAMADVDVVVASGAAGYTSDEGLMTPQGDGIRYCHIAERVAEHWPRPLRRFRYAMMGVRTVEWLASQTTRPAAVILYSGYSPYLMRLLPWCRRNGVRLIFDAVEWYEPTARWKHLTSPYQWNIEWAMRHLVPRTDGVIAISRYLADYYRMRAVPVALVPPTTTAMGQGDWHPDGTLRLCYTGNPGQKDDLQAVLEAVRRLALEGAPVHLTVAGPSRQEVHGLIGAAASESPAWLGVRGYLRHPDVVRLVSGVDFSILARRQCRTSQAGFPTKFVESFAVGTPVISNLTGDLHMHLRDTETGLVSAGPGASQIAAALRRALAMDEASMRRMREAALVHARGEFHPATYASVLRRLVGCEPQARSASTCLTTGS